MSKRIKLHAADGMIRNMRLGKLVEVAPNRNLIIEKSKDKYDRLHIKFDRIKLMIHNKEKLSEYSELAKIIASQITNDRKLKGAFSEKGINLYEGSAFIYSFDLNGVKLVDNHILVKEMYREGL